MKARFLWILLIVFCLCVFALTGCRKNKTSEEPAAPAAEQAAGGWTVSTEAAAPVIPDSAKEAFDAAVSEQTDAGYEPLAFLGSQVVAGSNYGFLCRKAGSEAGLCTVKVYRDLEGNASITEVKDFVISEFVNAGDVDFRPENLAGGWHLDPESGAAALPEEVQTAFDKAMSGMTGVSYQPLAYLGSQVVAGRNFAVLCNAGSVTAEPQSALAVVVIYADLSGGAELTSVSGFAFP